MNKAFKNDIYYNEAASHYRRIKLGKKNDNGGGGSTVLPDGTPVNIFIVWNPEHQGIIYPSFSSLSVYPFPVVGQTITVDWESMITIVDSNYVVTGFKNNLTGEVFPVGSSFTVPNSEYSLSFTAVLE